METIDTLIIGAGVVGLAIARSLSRTGKEVIVLDKNQYIGEETSSRNSEVVHAGLYYPTGSLKARCCVEGRQALYRFCGEYGVPHRKCGKVVVATNSNQIPALEALHRKARDNGVTDLVPLTQSEVAALEPAVTAVAGLFSPQTGIVDGHGFMLALLGDAEAHGAVFAPATQVTSIQPSAGGLVVRTQGKEAFDLKARTVVNCAGLWASFVAESVSGFDPSLIPETGWCKGNYFSLSGPNPFRHLVYPMPDEAGLGVHVTLDLGGQARFGPDTEWLSPPSHFADYPDYEVKDGRREDFAEAIGRYWPEVSVDRLVPGYAGVRPKLQRPGEPARDFLIQSTRDHGITGLVNLFGIESPGLTASLSLAEIVAELV